MNFKYSAFTENSPEMREHLKSIGYINLSKCNDEYLLTYDDSNEVGSYNLEFIKRAISEGREIINCLGNPALFKAVTAMREDSDYKQWFTDGMAWVLFDENKSKRYYEVYLHKATLSELQEHFKIR